MSHKDVIQARAVSGNDLSSLDNKRNRRLELPQIAIPKGRPISPAARPSYRPLQIRRD